MRCAPLMLLVFAATTARAEEPFDFHGMKLGTSPSAVEAQAPWKCVRPKRGAVGCFHDGTDKDAIGGLRPTDIWLIFRDDRVARIAVFLSNVASKVTLLKRIDPKFNEPVVQYDSSDAYGR
jgi:hypothetical protein